MKMPSAGTAAGIQHRILLPMEAKRLPLLSQRFLAHVISLPISMPWTRLCMPCEEVRRSHSEPAVSNHEFGHCWYTMKPSNARTSFGLKKYHLLHNWHIVWIGCVPRPADIACAADRRQSSSCSASMTATQSPQTALFLYKLLLQRPDASANADVDNACIRACGPHWRAG